MTTPRLKLAGVCLAILALAGSALADPIDFSFRQGPDEMIITVDDFRTFHSLLTNTGDNAEAFTLSVTATDPPPNWSFGVCVGEICYPPFQTEFRIPETGTMAPGETAELSWDVFALSDTGEATYTVQFASESDPSIAVTKTFWVSTPLDGRAILFSPGEGVESAPVDGYVQFHPMLYNAGTEADSYTLSVVRNVPASWQAMFCVGGVCYPPTEESIVLPVGGGQYAAGAQEPLDIDFAPLTVEGTGWMTVNIVSNTDPSVFSTATFTVTTGSVVAVGDTPQTSLVSDLKAAPNPFNPRTEIRFRVGGEVARDALVDIFDASGRHVRTLLGRSLAPGQEHALMWDGTSRSGRRAATGTYLARVTVGESQQAIKLSLVK